MIARMGGVAVLLFIALTAVAGNAPQQYSAIPGVKGQADQVEGAQNAASPAILRGHAKVTFPGFTLSAGRIELTYDPGAPSPTHSIYVLADGDVTLASGSHATRFRNMTFEIEAPK
jgi:hypothetical protein